MNIPEVDQYLDGVKDQPQHYKLNANLAFKKLIRFEAANLLVQKPIRMLGVQQDIPLHGFARQVAPAFCWMQHRLLHQPVPA